MLFYLIILTSHFLNAQNHYGNTQGRFEGFLKTGSSTAIVSPDRNNYFIDVFSNPNNIFLGAFDFGMSDRRNVRRGNDPNSPLDQFSEVDNFYYGGIAMALCKNESVDVSLMYRSVGEWGWPGIFKNTNFIYDPTTFNYNGLKVIIDHTLDLSYLDNKIPVYKILDFKFVQADGRIVNTGNTLLYLDRSQNSTNSRIERVQKLTPLYINQEMSRVYFKVENVWKQVIRYYDSELIKELVDAFDTLERNCNSIRDKKEKLERLRNDLLTQSHSREEANKINEKISKLDADITTIEAENQSALLDFNNSKLVLDVCPEQLHLNSSACPITKTPLLRKFLINKSYNGVRFYSFEQDTVQDPLIWLSIGVN